MNNDGWFNGAGQDDRMVAGKDLQHYTQPNGADEAPNGIHHVKRIYIGGGPMKEHLKEELDRHNESKKMRLEHLKR